MTEAPPKPRRRRRLLFRALGLLAPLLVLFLVGEIVVRWRYHEITARPYFLPGIYASVPVPRAFALLPDYEGTYFEGTSVIKTRTNALAMRDPALSPERAGAARRVLFLGDSITFGRGVADDATYPRRCEGLWKTALGREVACFNAGVPGYDTVQELATLAEVGTRLRPHLVLVGWYRNDVAVRTAVQPASVIEGQLARDQEDYEDFKRRTIDHQENLLDRSMFLRLVRWQWKELKLRLWKLSERAEDVDDQQIGDEQKGLRVSQEALLSIRAWCRENGARMGVVLFPSREDVEAGLTIDPPLLSDVRAFCQREEIEVLDLLPAWRAEWAAKPETLFLPRDRCHPNDRGHERVAAWVAEGFQKTLSGAGD